MAKLVFHPESVNTSLSFSHLTISVSLTAAKRTETIWYMANFSTKNSLPIQNIRLFAIPVLHSYNGFVFGILCLIFFFGRYVYLRLSCVNEYHPGFSSFLYFRLFCVPLSMHFFWFSFVLNHFAIFPFPFTFLSIFFFFFNGPKESYHLGDIYACKYLDVLRVFYSFISLFLSARFLFTILSCGFFSMKFIALRSHILMWVHFKTESNLTYYQAYFIPNIGW